RSCGARRAFPPADARPAHRAQAIHRPPRRGHAGSPRLALESRIACALMRAYGVGPRQPAATRVGPGAGPRAAHEWFFPAAALYAAVVLPLSVAGMIAGFLPFPGLADPSGHAHELLFGYGLAVVAGFLINRIGRAALVLLFSLWLAARATFLFAPDGVVTVFAIVAFAVLLAVLAAPQFLKAAQKLRNRLTGPLVIGLSAALVVFHGAVFASSGFVERLALHQ